MVAVNALRVAVRLETVLCSCRLSRICVLIVMNALLPEPVLHRHSQGLTLKHHIYLKDLEADSEIKKMAMNIKTIAK